MSGRIAGGLVGVLLALPLWTRSAVLTWDFETGDLQGWQVTEGFFEKPVSDRAKEHNTGKPYVKGGTWFLTTLENKRDQSVAAQKGRVQSPLVRLTAPTITFRIGGGNNQCDFCLVDRKTGEIYARTVGRNDEPLLPAAWKVPRADMAGFVPCAAHQARTRRFQQRAAEEKTVYDAIRQGRKHYDGE